MPVSVPGGRSIVIRRRSFTANAPEIVGPLLAAGLIGVLLLILLSPRLGFALPTDSNVVRIYSSVPMESFDSIAHGVQMAVDEAGGKAGNFRIEYVPLTDDKQQSDGSYHWDADVELANARRAAADPDAMVYIGTYNSGAAKISIPVLNRVRLTMISPGNTYPGLTKPGTGTAGEPWIYYPLGVQNYFRVVPADDLQGNAGAAYAQQIGAKSVYVIDDTELYGHGIAVIFAQAAKDLGLQVVGGPESIDVHTDDYSALASKIVAAAPDLVYFGGVTANHPARVLRDLRRAGFQGTFMGADGIVGSDFLNDYKSNGGSGSPGSVYATLVGLPANKLTGAGQDWYQRYISRYPNDRNPDFAPFGYEAGRVAVHGITKAGVKDREAIRQATAATKSTDLGPNILGGAWQFDANGDTSLVTISVQQLGADWAYQGVMSYDPQAKTWSFRQGQ
jgi:branched-chain amino acid transport system substrate-binding protein